MAKKTPLNGTVMSYKIDWTTLQQGLTVSDFCTINNQAYSVSYFNVSKIGKMIIGTFCISTSSTFGSDQINPITIKEGYRPSSTINNFCGFSANEYGVDGVGYFYVGTAGGVFLKTNVASANWAKISVIYKTN